MPIEDTTDAFAGANLGHHQVDPLLVGLPTGLTFLVVRLQAANVRVHALQPLLDDVVGQAGKNDVRLFDMAACQWGQVGAQGHAHANDSDAAFGSVFGRGRLGSVHRL